MFCKECKSNDWEKILNHIQKKGGKTLHLYQCRECKRIVAETSHTCLWDEEEV